MARPPYPPGTVISYVGGTALAGLLDAALEGQMGRQSMEALRYYIVAELAAHDEGRGPKFDNLIGFYTTFYPHHTKASQVARLRAAIPAIDALLAARDYL